MAKKVNHKSKRENMENKLRRNAEENVLIQDGVIMKKSLRKVR